MEAAMNPHQCPNCLGWGKRQTVSAITTIAPQWVTCPSCNGTGLVWAAESPTQPAYVPIGPVTSWAGTT